MVYNVLMFFYNLIYNIFFPITLGIAGILALFFKSLREHFVIRKYKPDLSTYKPYKYFWFHAASVGEYEQARALAQALKKKYPHIPQLFTIYSYSAYSQRRNDPFPDQFAVLPFDLWGSWGFVRKCPPAAIFYARYDLWLNLVHTLKKVKTLQVVFCAAFNEKKNGKLKSSSYIKKILFSKVDYIFTVNERNKKAFQELFYSLLKKPQIEIGYDTRAEAIEQRKKNVNHSIRKSLTDTQTALSFFSLPQTRLLIAGSTYLFEEKMLTHLLSYWPHFRLILAPHKIDDAHLGEIEKYAIKNNLTACRLSLCLESINKKFSPFAPPMDILIIDKIGILLHLYDMADVVYVGGGYRKKVHNVLEPMLAQKHVICGPNYYNSPEAIELKRKKMLLSLPSAKTPEQAGPPLKEALIAIDKKSNKEIKDWIAKRSNSSKIILGFLKSELDSRLLNSDESV